MPRLHKNAREQHFLHAFSMIMPHLAWQQRRLRLLKDILPNGWIIERRERNGSSESGYPSEQWTIWMKMRK